MRRWYTAASIDRRRMPLRSWIGCTVLLLALAWCSAGQAQAFDDELPSVALPPLRIEQTGEETFRYTTHADAYPFRAAIEELGLFGLGLVQYFSNLDANSRDFEFDYSWPSFRNKVSGAGYALDTNKFDTNFLTHPGSGTLYYWAARSNRLSVLESLGYAVVVSTLWEMLGEFRERASVNDLIVTPVGGMILGEATLQLGAFFDRSCESNLTLTLGWLFGAAKSVHDAIDHKRVLRDDACDDRGFTERIDHEFRVTLSEALVLSRQGPSDDANVETQFAVATRVVALPSYGKAGRDIHTFSDGNVSEMQLEGGFMPTLWNDLTLRVTTVPAGLHFRDLRPDGAFGGVRGYELLFGVSLATEYAVHRYDRVSAGSGDATYFLDAPGINLQYRRHTRDTRWMVDIEASPSMAALDAFALPAYLASRSRELLTSVARAHGYNYAIGLMMRVRARFTLRWLDFGADLTMTRLWGINDFDQDPSRQSVIPDTEGRRKLRAWVDVGPRDQPLRFSLTGNLLQRWGTLASFENSRTELQLSAGVSAVL